MKNKNVAGVLALLFGIFGVHRFYLGKRFWGVVHMALFFFCMVITAEENVPAVLLPALIGFVDAILFFVMPQEDFDERYNRKYLANSPRAETPDFRRERTTRRRNTTPAHPPRSNPYKKRGIERFREYEYEEAIEDFLKALEYQENDPAVHFNLACCYSILEDAEPALDHLEQAVACGFRDLEKIKTHTALAFLRAQPEFDTFVENGYQQVAQLPQPEPDLLSSQPQKEEEDLLDQIVKLGALRDQGILTEAEFSEQKKKILGD